MTMIVIAMTDNCPIIDYRRTVKRVKRGLEKYGSRLLLTEVYMPHYTIIIVGIPLDNVRQFNPLMSINAFTFWKVVVL